TVDPGDVMIFNAGVSLSTKTGIATNGTIAVGAHGVVTYQSIALTEIALSEANAGTYAAIAEGDGITLSATGTVVATGRTVAYAWDLNGDGEYGDRTGVVTTLTW